MLVFDQPSTWLLQSRVLICDINTPVILAECFKCWWAWRILNRYIYVCIYVTATHTLADQY